MEDRLRKMRHAAHQFIQLRAGEGEHQRMTQGNDVSRPATAAKERDLADRFAATDFATRVRSWPARMAKRPSTTK